MYLHRRAVLPALLVPLLFALSACSDQTSTPAAPDEDPTPELVAPLQDGIISVPSPVGDLTFWPYTTDAPVAPLMELAKDPISQIFVGPGADPRVIRAALMGLELGRPTFLGLGPFACTWTDAVGSAQFVYGEPAGWQGAAVQLQCGDYDPLRFHLRLYDMGDYTLGAVHWDFLIPGTTDHQVLTWENAEGPLNEEILFALGWQFLQPALMNPSPSPFPHPDNWFRTIPAQIYDAIMAAGYGGILMFANPVPNADGLGNWGIRNDGVGPIFEVPPPPPDEPGAEVMKREFTIEFNQDIPKPFCGDPQTDFLHVEGPVHFKQHVVTSASGNFISSFHAKGHLELTPLPDGKTYKAVVNEQVKGIITDKKTMVSSFTMRFEIPSKGPDRGKLFVKVRVNGDGTASYSLEVRC